MGENIRGTSNIGRDLLIINQESNLNEHSVNTSKRIKSMNCHGKSEPHIWRFSKHTKMRRCVKCKSKIPITKEEFTLKWGLKKT